MTGSPLRIAFIVTHPIQYYAPLYQRLAGRDDVAIKVFFTWHAGGSAVLDSGFGIPVAWDVPLTDGYEFELVPNIARMRGSDRFRGVRNPELISRVCQWAPDVVHVTGWAYQSHLAAMRSFARRRLPVLFRGDSHLLDDPRRGPKWWLKQSVLRHVYSWPTRFLVTGTANRAYYEAFGVAPDRLNQCPHSIDVARFAGPGEVLEREAREWRRALGIEADTIVLLFAGKFEERKRPVDLMRAVSRQLPADVVLVLVGDGVLKGEIEAMAASEPARFRVLPFQNQNRMPVVYRLGDVFVLPSSRGETWGLAVNEALACGRPVVVSDRVGCAEDVVDADCGRVFSWAKPGSLARALTELCANPGTFNAMRRAAARRAWAFDITVTERALMAAASEICAA